MYGKPDLELRQGSPAPILRFEDGQFHTFAATIRHEGERPGMAGAALGGDRGDRAVMPDHAEHSLVFDEGARARRPAFGRTTIVLDAQRPTAAERKLDGRQSASADLRDIARKRRREADLGTVSGY